MATYNPDHRGYTDLESLFRGDIDEGALHLELGKDALPPKPKVIWDVQTGHRRLCPVLAEPMKAESASTASTAASSDSPVPETLGAPGYLLSVAPGPNPTQRPLRHTAPGEFFAQFRRPRRSVVKDQQKRSEVLAAVTSLANEQKALIDSILEQCDKVSRMILLATANALRESNARAEKPMPWMTARSHIKKELAQLAGMDEVHRLLDVHQLDYPETDQTLLYCSPEERNVKVQMESFLLQQVKKFAKNERICEFDLERVQKRLHLHSKDAEGVLNYAGHEDSGKAAQRWFKQTEALAMAALKDHETGQHKIFAGFAQTLTETTSRMARDNMGTTGFSMSDTHASFEHVPTAPQGSVLLQPEERDMLQGLEMQKKQKEKAVWELKRQLDALMDKRRKMDEDVAPQTSASEGPKSGGERRLQHAKSVKEMDQALDTLDEERFQARRSMENAGPQMAKMVDFMTTGQRNLRHLLEDLKKAEQKQLEVHQQLEELVWPESKTLVHDMVRNKEMAIELLDASILPVAGSSSSIRISDENMSQVIADSKNVSNQQLVAAARQRQQLRQEKEAKELELEQRRAAAVAAKAEKDALNGVVTLDEAEASLGLDTSLVKDVKGMCLRGNMLLSDLRHEQKDNFVDEVPANVAHVMEEMKEAIAKTSKVLAGKLDMDTVPSLTGEFEDVEITVINLKMSQSRGTERRGAMLKRSVRHVEDVLEEAAEERPQSSEKDVRAEKLRQLKEEVETNRVALAQLERRVQRMRVAVKQAESEAQSRGRVSTISSVSPLNLTQSSWLAEQSAQSSSQVAEEEDDLSVGSEFDSDAEDLACVSTLMLPRKSSAQKHAGSVVKKESQAESRGGSIAMTRQASHPAAQGAQGGGRPRPEPIVTPSLSQAETVERKKSLRALKQAKLVHEGLQEDLEALRRDVDELRKAKGLDAGLPSAQGQENSAAVASPSGATQDAAQVPSENEGPVRTASGRFAQLVRSHSGRILEGVQKSSSLGFAMIGSTKALDKQRRDLTNQVKSLKQEVQKKKKLLMAMVPKDNLQDLINAGVFPGEQKTPSNQDNSVDKQVLSLKNKLETLKKSVAFWQTRLENHVQKFNAMVEGPPQSTPGVQDSEMAETSPSRASQEITSSPSASSSRWKSTLSRHKSNGTLSDLSDHEPPNIVMHTPGGQGQPSLQASGLAGGLAAGLQVSAVRRVSTEGQGPNAPPKASDLLKKLKHAGGLVATMQRGGVLHKSAHHAVHQREALHLGQRRHSRDSQSSVGAEGLADLVEGHGVGVGVAAMATSKSNFSDIAQQAVQSALEKQENVPPSPKKEMTRSKAFTALKREVHLLAFAAHARMKSKGNHRGERDAREHPDVAHEAHEVHERTNRWEEHRPQELDSLEDSDGEDSDQSGEETDTPRTKLQNAMIKVKMTNFLRKAAQEVRQEAQKAAEEAKQTQAPETPRLSVTEYARNLTQAAGLPVEDADRLIDMMRLLSDQFLPFVYQQLLDMLSMPLHEQKTALKMLSLGHVDVSSPMRSKGEGAKSLGIASLLATQLLAMKQAAGLWDEKTIQANALLKTLELDQEADASGDLQIEALEDEEGGQRLLSYYKRARLPSMRGQKRRFVDASGSKPFMARSIVRRPKTKSEANLELEGEQLVHERPALPSMGPSMGSQGHSHGPAVDPLSIDLESSLDPEELALLRRAQSWSLRPRKHKDLDSLGDAASEGMRGYRRRASRDLDNYDSDFWDDLQARVRVQKTELYEEIQEKRREEWRKLGIEGDESPRSSPSKTKGLRGNFQFGGGQTKETKLFRSRSQKFRKSNTTIELNLDPQGAALRRRFWLGDLAEEPQEDLSSGSDGGSLKHSKSMGDLSPGRQLRRLSHKGYARTSDRQVDLSPRHLHGGLAARPAIKALKFLTRGQSPGPGGFVKLEGGMVKFAADSPVDHLQSYTPRGFGMRGRSKERGLPSFHLDKKSRRGQNDFRRGSSMFRRSFTTPAQRQESMSLYERSLTRRMLGRREARSARSFSKNLAVQALLRKQKAAPSRPLARRISEVRRGSLTHQLNGGPSFGAGGASSVTLGARGAISVTHYAPAQRRKMRHAKKPRVRVTSHEESLVPEMPKPTIRPKFDGWTKQEPGQGIVLSRLREARGLEAALQPGAPFGVPPVSAPVPAPAPAPSAKSAAVAALAAQSPGEASVTQEAQPRMKEGAADDAEKAALELAKKLPLLPARKMAEIPVDEASVRLRMNLMLFHRSRGDSPGPPGPPNAANATPRQPLPQLTTPRLPMANQAAADANPAVSPKKAVPAMPQFSSLKGGFTPIKGMGWPHSARESAAGSRTEKNDSGEVSQKAKEMLYYLQSFDRAPLQRLLSSREGPRAKTEPRRPNENVEAKAGEQHLPPIKKEGGRATSQAAAWAQFLEERLGRHLRTLSKSTPPPREVKSREIRRLLLD